MSFASLSLKPEGYLIVVLYPTKGSHSTRRFFILKAHSSIPMSSKQIKEPRVRFHVTWSHVGNTRAGRLLITNTCPGCVTSLFGVNSIRLCRQASLRYTLYTAASALPSSLFAGKLSTINRGCQCHLIIPHGDVNCKYYYYDEVEL